MKKTDIEKTNKKNVSNRTVPFDTPTNTKRTIILVIFALTLIFIWGHSCMPKSASREESDAVGNFLMPIYEFFFGKGNVTAHIIRKTAHVTEFFVLGVELSLMLVWGWVVRLRDVQEGSAIQVTSPAWLSNLFQHSWLRALVAIAVAFAIAAIDETIQIFSNRGPLFTDVLIDTAGATGGVAVMTVVYLIFRKSSKE